MEILLDPSPKESKSNVGVDVVDGSGTPKRSSDVEKGSLGKINKKY